MMTYRQIMAWARRWHYPFLVLDRVQGLVLYHGKEHYQALRRDRRRQLLAILRIRGWQARATVPRVATIAASNECVMCSQSAQSAIRRIVLKDGNR